MPLMFVNQLDHMGALLRAEDLDATIRQLSFSLQTSFYGPVDRVDIGARIATSWDAGITLIAPIPGGTGHIEAALAARGPGWWTPAFGIASMDEHFAHMSALGHEPPRVINCLTGVEPWEDRFLRVEEASYPAEVYGGLPVTLCAVEQYSDMERAAPPDRTVGHVQYAAALVRLDDLDTVVARMSTTLGIAFDAASDRADLGARVVTSRAGLHLMSPLPGGRGRIAEEMDRRGPGWWSIGFGVRDLERARARLSGASHRPVSVDSLTGEQARPDVTATAAAHDDGTSFGGLPVTLYEVGRTG